MSHEAGADLEAGLAFLRHGQFASAERLFRELAARAPQSAVWFGLGAAQHGLGQLEAAAASFARAVALDAQATQARCARATVLAALGRVEEAEAELRRAIETSPADPEALCNLAILCERRGARAEALGLYDRALEAQPAHYGARLNRGAARLAAGDAPGALADFDRLAGEHVASAEVQGNLARALFALHRDEEALRAAQAARVLEPGNARAWLDTIIATASLGRLDEAKAIFARAHAALGERLLAVPGGPRRPEELDPLALYIGRALERQSICDWRDRDRLVATLREAIAERRCATLTDPGTPVRALSLPLTEPEIGVLAEAVAAGVRERASGLILRDAASMARRDARIRVGFVSPDFRLHPGAFLMRPLFLERDRARFEYYAYALNPDDGAAVRAELARAADLFVDVSAWSTQEIAERIRGDRLDILVDRTGYLEGTRPELLALRLAPAQATFMGTPCTLGKGLAHYRLSDACVTPLEWQPCWHERLILLPPPHVTFDTGQPPLEPGRRSDHGLPQDALVLCNFDLAYKIGPEVFATWMRLLRRAPRAVLWLLDWGGQASANLRREAQAHGVAPGRLVFAPRVSGARHPPGLAHADLFLDTFYCNAHTVPLDALWLGVPVLTHLGDKMASRRVASYLRSLGLAELIAGSFEDYEARALELCTQPESLSRLRSTLAAARATAPLFDPVARVRAVERAFAEIAARQRAGLPPDTLVID